MVSINNLEPVANKLLLLTNILSNVKIHNLVVPDVIANDCLEAVLDCAYSGAIHDVTVLWLINGTQVYEWRYETEPKIRGVFVGHIDQTYRFSNSSRRGISTVENQSLKLVELTPELSGDYTCIVRSRGQEATATKSMTVFSPERDFEVTFSQSLAPDVVSIRCAAKKLHPQPDLIIEHNKIPIIQQQQRIWRTGAYYDTESVALIPRSALRVGGEVACRLRLPQVDYTAITKKYFNFYSHASRGCVVSLKSPSLIIILVNIRFIFE